MRALSAHIHTERMAEALGWSIGSFRRAAAAAAAASWSAFGNCCGRRALWTQALTGCCCCCCCWQVDVRARGECAYKERRPSHHKQISNSRSVSHGQAARTSLQVVCGSRQGDCANNLCDACAKSRACPSGFLRTTSCCVDCVFSPR